MAKTITMRDLLEAGIHFGHQTHRWNPKMGRYIFGQRNGIYIIDLQKTMRQIKRAYVTVRDIVAGGGTVLFVGTKKQAQEAIAHEAERCGMYYVNERWLGGTLTNWQTIRQSIRSLIRLEEMDGSGKLDEMFKKKEAIRMRKQAAKIDKALHGIKNMAAVPAAMFVVDTRKEAIAVREAARLNIPCIGIVDTNCDPDVVPIPVPGNDDAIRSIGLFCSIVAEAVLDGKMQADKRMADEANKDARPAPKDTMAEMAPEAHAPVPAPAPAPEAAPEAEQDTETEDAMKNEE